MKKSTNDIVQQLDQLPTDYLNFMSQHAFQSFEYVFGRDEWKFWGHDQLASKNQRLREQGFIGSADIAFASTGWQEKEVLFFKENDGTIGPHIYHVNCEDGDVMFFAFSMSQLTNFKKREKLIKGIGKTTWKTQDLSDIADCPGSLYWYAFSLKTSAYDKNYSKERNQRALEIFHELAGLGHPDAAHEVACHYYFQDDPDIEKIIEWRERAIALGSMEDAYELADFIMDNELASQMPRAIELLESLRTNCRYKHQALLKLSRIYIHGLHGSPDISKGIGLVEEAAALGYVLAISDLAGYYYKGIGVQQNTRKAYELLLEAEKIHQEKGDFGHLEPILKKLAAELGS